MKIDKKIELIDTLLNNNIELDKYIQNIENSELETPVNLECSINEYILNNVNKKDTIKTNKTMKFRDIIKIAACTVLSLLIWYGYVNIDTSTTTSNTKDHQFIGKMQSYSNKLNGFMLKTINIERRDK